MSSNPYAEALELLGVSFATKAAEYKNEVQIKALEKALDFGIIDLDHYERDVIREKMQLEYLFSTCPGPNYNSTLSFSSGNQLKTLSLINNHVISLDDHFKAYRVPIDTTYSSATMYDDSYNMPNHHNYGY